MKLRLIDCAYARGEGSVNEDLFGWDSSTFWVLDGATQIEGPAIDPISDARWLVELIDHSLRTRRPPTGSAAGADFEFLSNEVQRRLAEERFPATFTPPACSALLAWLDEGELVTAALGDVTVAAFNGRDVSVEHDEYFGKREHRAVVRADGVLEARPGGSVFDGIKARREEYIRGVDGKFILSNNPEAASGVRSWRHPVRPGDHILLASDGFCRLIDGYGITTWSDLFPAVLRTGLSSAIALLRKFEIDTTHERRNFKSSDDATALLLMVTK